MQEGAYLDFQKVISLKPKEIPPEYTTHWGIQKIREAYIHTTGLYSISAVTFWSSIDVTGSNLHVLLFLHLQQPDEASLSRLQSGHNLYADFCTWLHHRVYSAFQGISYKITMEEMSSMAMVHDIQCSCIHCCHCDHRIYTPPPRLRSDLYRNNISSILGYYIHQGVPGNRIY